MLRDEHNHQRGDGKLLPSNRRRQRSASGRKLGNRMEQLIQIQKLTAADIARQLSEEFPENGIVSRDVQNMRLKKRRLVEAARTTL